MKKKLSITALLFVCGSVFSQVGINTSTPHESSALDVSSDTKGLLVPRLTTAAVNTLSATASEGLIVFDKEKKLFLGWDGSKWQNLGTTPQIGVIFSQGFETSSSINYTLTGSSTTSFSFTSGNSGSGDAPASSALYSEGTRGYGYSNSNTSGTTSYVEFNNIDASAYSNNLTFSFDVAAFSVGSTSNGLETNDFVSVDVSIDGGVTYDTKLTLQGGNSAGTNNIRWAFSGSGTATNSYSSTNVNVTSSSTATGGSGATLTGAQAITKLSVTGIPNSSQLKIRIGVKNNAAAELWVIDNVKLEAL